MAAVAKPLDLRYSPSGPFLGEIPGSPFRGMPIRLAESTLETALIPVTTVAKEIVNGTGVVLAAELPAPTRDRMYKVNATVQYMKIGPANGSIQFRVQVQWVEGGPWQWVAGNQYDYTQGEDDYGPRQACVNFPATLGSALPVGPVPLEATRIRVRVQVTASANDLFVIPAAYGEGNVAWLSLVECVG